MLNLCKFLMLSAICATPLFAMEAQQEAEMLELPEGNTSLLSPCASTSHHVAPNREELLEKLKYIGPILQSRIDYNNQVLPLMKEIKRLEKGRADKKEKVEKTHKNASSIKERLQLTIARNELTSLQRQIDENLAKLHEITDFDFDASQLNCFIYFKETDQKTNLTAQQLYEHIQSPSHDENSLDAINNLYAYLSTATHLNKAKTMTEEEYLLMQRNGGSAVREGQTLRLAGFAQRTNDSQKEFRDRAYHKMILDLLRPHCSERSKMFHSFFTRKDNGSIDIGCQNHLEKCKKIFGTIFNINHTTEKQNNDMAREKAFQETQIFLDEAVRIQESRKQVINSSCDTINQVFSGNKVHEMLSNHVIFRTCYLQTSDIFLIVQSICSQTLTSLSALLCQYDAILTIVSCTKKPAFLSVCQEILAQPYYDPGSNFDSYDDGLTIEEKLAKLSIHEEESTKASAEEDAEEKIDQKASGSSKTKTGGKKKGKKKKKKKRAPAAAYEHDEESSDDEEAESSANDIQTGLSATVPTALETSLSETTLSSSSVVYLEPTAGASRGTNKVLPDAIKQPYQHGKGKKSAVVETTTTHQPPFVQPAMKKAVQTTASTPITPWMIDLMRAHEYNFKDTIKSIYYGLADMGLKPDFMTRNEKFVLGFMSPLTNQPFAITEDIPHGAQLRKGQAAGWIKKIKYSLREHGVIPTGC